MPTYISLMKLTGKGIAEIKDSRRRIEEAREKMEAMGSKIVGLYVTMGEYDMMAIVEGTNDEAALTFLLGLGAEGNVRTVTMRAFTAEEFVGIVDRLP
jgi:uncharacterized protein with GYD domain